MAARGRPKGRQGASRDSVDEHLAVWRKEAPALDPVTEGIVERLGMLARHFELSLGQTTASLGLSLADWKLLCLLRSSGPPYQMSPTMLAESMMVSPGAMTNRIDNLEEQGLVRRTPDPADRRALRVGLTPKGHRTFERTASVQSAKEQLVADSLAPREKQQLNNLLRRMLLYFEADADQAGEE